MIGSPVIFRSSHLKLAWKLAFTANLPPPSLQSAPNTRTVLTCPGTSGTTAYRINAGSANRSQVLNKPFSSSELQAILKIRTATLSQVPIYRQTIQDHDCEFAAYRGNGYARTRAAWRTRTTSPPFASSRPSAVRRSQVVETRAAEPITIFLLLPSRDSSNGRARSVRRPNHPHRLAPTAAAVQEPV